jgi:hypothetical protein
MAPDGTHRLPRGHRTCAKAAYRRVRRTFVAYARGVDDLPHVLGAFEARAREVLEPGPLAY